MDAPRTEFNNDGDRTPLWLATPHNDRGMIDLLGAMLNDPAKAAAAALLEEKREIVVCTGFPVRGAPETDGPPGAIALIEALRRIGKNVRVASWKAALEIITTVIPDVLTVDIPIVVGQQERHPLDSAVVTIEVCGRCPDGSYRNMHGEDISVNAPKFEDIFGTVGLVSIGDGGNEFGMGSAPSWFFERHKILRPISTADYLIPASTSNYGAYALIKELELVSRQRLLPDPIKHAELICRLVELGCVDGFTGEARPAVDGRDLTETTRLLEALHSL